MKTYSHTTHQFDLFPASLLAKRRLWQKMTQGLPTNGCLLIMQKENTAQAQMVQRLGWAFQAQGRRVFVLSVGYKDRSTNVLIANRSIYCHTTRGETVHTET